MDGVDARYLGLTANQLAKIATDLKAENAKLRKLVADAHACKENDGCCEDCYVDEGDCPIEQRMRELGVEAGE